jgi:hypothetical protein
MNLPFQIITRGVAQGEIRDTPVRGTTLYLVTVNTRTAEPVTSLSSCTLSRCEVYAATRTYTRRYLVHGWAKRSTRDWPRMHLVQ